MRKPSDQRTVGLGIEKSGSEVHPEIPYSVDGGGGNASGITLTEPNGERAEARVSKESRERDRRRRVTPSTSRVKRRQTRLRNTTMREWAARIREDAQAMQNRTVQACLPILKRWVNRKHGRLSYRTTQVLTGHGCFGEFLSRIGREPTAGCHHCGAERDLTEHTEWRSVRRGERQGRRW